MKGLYQPRIKDNLIRRLYFAAKREGKKMTHLINEIMEEYLVDEPEPPPYEEKQYVALEANPNTLKRKTQQYKKLVREYHGDGNGTPTQERQDQSQTRGVENSPADAQPKPYNEGGNSWQEH